MVTAIPPVEHLAAGTPATGRASVLELMLPSGAARGVLVLGANCPPVLRPMRDGAEGQPGAVDLCLLAPDDAECRSESWVARAAAQAATKLTPDGIVYILVAPRWRGRLLRALAAHGLHYRRGWQHQPDPAASRYLVPFERRAFAFTYGGLIPVRPWRRRLALTAMWLPGWRRQAALHLATAGLVVRRKEARPLFEWLYRAAGIEGTGEVVIGSSWRGHGTLVLYALGTHGARPVAVAKTALTGEETGGACQEAKNIEHLAAGARMAGAHVPALVSMREIGNRTVVVQTVVPGRPASHVLAAEPARLEALLTGLAGWLGRWHAGTRQDKPLAASDLKRWILHPAAALAPELTGSEAFAARLARLCAEVGDKEASLVATHGDLTMANVLIAGSDARLGVVDWEQAEAAGLPMTDFYYAATDAVAASAGYRNRGAAFASCFVPGGNHTELVGRLARRLTGELGLSPSLAELCFYACWLHHAANEQATARPGESRPFLEMLQQVVTGAIGMRDEGRPVWR